MDFLWSTKSTPLIPGSCILIISGKVLEPVMLVLFISLKDCCNCHAFSITEQQSNWLVIKPLIATCFLGK